MDQTQLAAKVAELQAKLSALAAQADALAVKVATAPAALAGSSAGHGDFFVTGLTVFALACFVGYYVVWRVTPALHSPLMAVTNAVSSVIIVGALIAAGPADFSFSQFMGFLAVILASVNIFGGFLVTQRMLSMFKKKGK
jgi:H+-translocating NAD(P) transhydrogenase subunit alpha